MQHTSHRVFPLGRWCTYCFIVLRDGDGPSASAAPHLPIVSTKTEVFAVKRSTGKLVPRESNLGAPQPIPAVMEDNRYAFTVPRWTQPTALGHAAKVSRHLCCIHALKCLEQVGSYRAAFHLAVIFQRSCL
ncbi:hypothetical protein NDU88_006117 [Pleurodeles waltl]|uniref:Uncharacterized protein n=1 Tax=Pleurodeles waltl TaxID=8319 RepID=A0AAV7PIV4_PLEWA|nr:hypothetical protein NDU88_006117 [Pleurodeles waltl]